MRNREVAKKGDIARDLAKLTEHPSWPTLRAVFADAREKAERRLSREMFSGGETHAPIDQRAIDYRRGFLRGCQAVLDAPELAQQAFERALETEEKRGSGRV